MPVIVPQSPSDVRIEPSHTEPIGQVIRALGLSFSYALIFLIVVLPFTLVFLNLRRREFNPVFAGLLLLLVEGTGASLGIGIALRFPTLTLLAFAGTGLPLAALLLSYPSIERRLLLAKYQKSEERLIQPDRSQLLQ